MDSPNSAVRKSLQEIATLLFYLYEHYVKDGEYNKKNTFDGFMAFMGDLKLLDNSVSLIEIETVFRKTLGANRSTHGISYEEFYSSLRRMGCILYKGHAENSRRALHFLLTEKIIPLASTWGSSLAFSSNISELGDKPIIDGIYLFQFFLRLWFLQIVSGTQTHHRAFVPMKAMWSLQLAAYPRGVSIEALLRNFTDLGICPHHIPPERVVQYAEGLFGARGDLDYSKPSVDRSALSFSDFLLIIYMSARDMDSLQPGLSAEATYHPGLHAILQTAAENYLHAALHNWRQHETKRNKQLGLRHSIVYESGENPLLAIGMSASSVMWICRQGNLIHEAEDFCRIVDCINQYGSGDLEEGDEYYAAWRKAHPGVEVVASTRIPSLLSLIGGIVMKHRRDRFDKDVFPSAANFGAGNLIHKSDRADHYLHSLVGSTELSSEGSALSLTCPGILFADCHVLPADLEELYCPESADAIKTKREIISDILESITIAKREDDTRSEGDRSNSEGDFSFDYSNMISYDETRNLSFTLLMELFRSSKMIPLLMNFDTAATCASNILQRRVSYRPTIPPDADTDNMLSVREVLEVLFYISQVIFGGAAESFSPEYLSIVLRRESNEDHTYTWSTGPSVIIPFDLGRQIPKLCVADTTDRFYCLLDLCDRSKWGLQVIERLEISTTSEKATVQKSKTLHLASTATPSRFNLIKPPEDKSLDAPLPLTVGMEMYSSKLGNLLNSFLTKVNLYKFKHADINVIEGSQEMSFVQRMLILIFIHFPVNDFALNPWDLADIINQSTLTDDSYIEDSKKDYTRLQLDMRYICTRFQIDSTLLVSYMEHILSFEIESPYRDEECDPAMVLRTPFALLLPHLDHVFSFSVLHTLSQGSNLLLWEFLRCVRGNFRNERSDQLGNSGPKNPFLEDIVCPFPTERVYSYRHSELIVCRKGIINWTTLHGLDYDKCTEVFDSLTRLVGAPYLTFSSFVIFAVLSYSRSRRSTSRDVYLESIRTLLDRINDDMDRVQKLLCRSICFSALGEIYSSSATCDERESAALEVLESGLTRFNDICNSLVVKVITRSGKRDTSVDGPAVDMPPRPPLSLWDAPRFVYFCKCLGILGTVSTLSSAWTGFAGIIEEGYLPSQRQGWDSSVVPPLPIQISPQAISKILGNIALHSVYADNGLNKVQQTPLPGHIVVILTSIVPVLVGIADDNVTFSTKDSIVSPKKTSKRDKNPPLDDLLRYGGNRVLTALDRFFPWILNTYSELASEDYFPNAGDREPLLRNVCQFMSKSKIFSLGTVSVLMKASLSPRIRGCPALSPQYIKPVHKTRTPSSPAGGSSRTNGHDIGVSFPELEEFLIRCAYLLWRKADIADVKDINAPDFYQHVKAALPSVEESLVSLYCEQCRESLRQSRGNAPIMKPRHHQATVNSKALGQDFRSSVRAGGKTWGIDYLQPFCSLLEASLESVVVPKKLFIAGDASPMKKTTSVENPGLEQTTTTPATKLPHRNIKNADESNGPTAVVDLLLSVDSKSEAALANIKALRDAAVMASNDSVDEMETEMEIKSSSVSRRVTIDSSLPKDIRLVTPEKPVAMTSTGSSSPVPRRQTPSPHRAQNIKILEGTKEALWPVFATYCSCGDSSDPGKLSGPNLFALLSKLDLLTNDTTIPDLGILLHQITAHSLAQSSTVGSSVFKNQQECEDDMSPLLSFEEFLVFLCVFAELRFEGTIEIPLLSAKASDAMSRTSVDHSDLDNDEEEVEDWFDKWSEYMIKSSMFRRLLEDCVLPPLQRSLVLASPEDARHRDEFRMLFSLEILFGIETIEKKMKQLYKVDQHQLQTLKPECQDPIIDTLIRIKIVPAIVSENEVMQLVADILPKNSLMREKTGGSIYKYRRSAMNFPQWQWVICVIAFQSVMASIRMCRSDTPTGNLSSLVGEVLTTLTDAMSSSW